MTLDEIAVKAQDNLLDIMQTVKILKEEIIALNKTNSELQKQLDDLNDNSDNIIDHD